MAGLDIILTSADLAGMAREISDAELGVALSALDTKDGKNGAHLDPVPPPGPDTGVVILPAPAVAPAGAEKICDGKLHVNGQDIDVTAFRLPA